MEFENKTNKFDKLEFKKYTLVIKLVRTSVLDVREGLFYFLAMPFGSFMEVSVCLDVIMKKMLKVVTGNGQLSIMTIG